MSSSFYCFIHIFIVVKIELIRFMKNVSHITQLAKPVLVGKPASHIKLERTKFIFQCVFEEYYFKGTAKKEKVTVCPNPEHLETGQPPWFQCLMWSFQHQLRGLQQRWPVVPDESSSQDSSLKAVFSVVSVWCHTVSYSSVWSTAVRLERSVRKNGYCGRESGRGRFPCSLLIFVPLLLTGQEKNLIIT